MDQRGGAWEVEEVEGVGERARIRGEGGWVQRGSGRKRRARGQFQRARKLEGN